MSNGRTTPLFTLAPTVVLAPSASTRNVIAVSTNVTPLVIKGSAAQTVALQDWQTNAGVSMVAVSPGSVANMARLSFNSTVANSPMVVNVTGQTFGATFDPMLVLGYNMDVGSNRINTSDAAWWVQLEANYEQTRGGTVHDCEISYGIISPSGAKNRRTFGHTVNRDDPDTWSVFTFGINNSLNGRVEIVDIANNATRIYDLRYDGFFNITSASPNLVLTTTAVPAKSKSLRVSGNSFQIVDNAYTTVILDIGDTGLTTHISKDAGTNTVANLMTLAHRTTSTPAAGLGSGLVLAGQSSTTADINLGRIIGEWVDPTHASRKARTRLTAYDTAEREGLRVEASGVAPMVGLYGATAVIRATTSGAAATFAANTSGIANNTATWDGYTIGQVVTALRNIGVLT